MTNEHSLRLLDFARIREDVGGYCLSEEGRSGLLEELPRQDPREVAALKAGVSSLVALFQTGEEIPALSFPPIGMAVKRLGKEGAGLELEELYALGLWAESFSRFTTYVGKTSSLGPRSEAAPAAAVDVPVPGIDLPWSRLPEPLIPALLAPEPSLAEVTKVVFRILNKDGTLKDLPELKAARDRIARAHRDISLLTESYFKVPETRSLLQSDAPTIRDGRTVLAVRANYKGRIKGIVHEVSATGQTVFIEPEELVQKNNELVQEEARYLQEVNRVLREATERLASEAPALGLARRLMAGLDGLYARARHCRLSGYFLARDLEAGFQLKTARHPLLGRKAVPIDVVLPEGTRTLIITGPNTGGKTVTLKTIGLLAMMNQFGLGIPASLESGFAVFDEVFADIGDEQSIDQSLSTFSGHMRVIGDIANRAGPRSLVLLDELGSGTDPEEGCAVAMGLLDWFVDSGCLTVLTTHHGILKNYGYTRPGCLNASMDFDAASLQPTYRVLMGVPGESRALDVASQHGVRGEIIEGARKYLAEERADVSELIRGLTEKHRRMEDLESESVSRLKDAKEEQRKADLARLRLRQKEVELREQGVADLKRLLGESRKTLENLVRDLREGELSPEKTRAVKDFLQDFALAVDGESGKLGAERRAVEEERRSIEGGPRTKAAKPREAEALREGLPVLVGPSRKKGVLLRLAKKGQWIVEMGSLKLTVAETDLEADPTAADPSLARTQVAVELAPRGEDGRVRAVFELDLRGKRLSEALEAVEKQLDAAALQGLSLFSIIHGTGEGVLGPGIQGFLKKHAGVAEYHFARPEEGGYGKTVVRLK